MNWRKPILTDSGGFQIFSLAEMSKLTEQGVVFRSPVNGDKVELTPERSIDAQMNFGSDIIMVLMIALPLRSRARSDSMNYRWQVQNM